MKKATATRNANGKLAGFIDGVECCTFDGPNKGATLATVWLLAFKLGDEEVEPDIDKCDGDVVVEYAHFESEMQVVTDEGETRGELRKVFDEVTAGLPHWKDPIVCRVKRKYVDKAVRAIEFFVGGPTMRETPKYGEGVILRNAGYYVNIGA